MSRREQSRGSGDRPKAKSPAKCANVYEWLDDVRVRPGMWVRGGSLRELEIMLWGYGVALQVHGVSEPFPFGSERAFSDWLHDRFGWGTNLGWAHAIQENAGDQAPLDFFFQLVDDYRNAHHPAPRA